MQNARLIVTWCSTSTVERPGSLVGEPIVNVPAGNIAYPDGHENVVHAPAAHNGVLPEHAEHPAAEDDVPQCATSVAEHVAHVPPAAQYQPVPQSESVAQLQPPLRRHTSSTAASRLCNPARSTEFDAADVTRPAPSTVIVAIV